VVLAGSFGSAGRYRGGVFPPASGASAAGDRTEKPHPTARKGDGGGLVRKPETTTQPAFFVQFTHLPQQPHHQVDPKSAAAVFLDQPEQILPLHLEKQRAGASCRWSEELKFAESFVRLQKTRFETRDWRCISMFRKKFFHRKIVPGHAAKPASKMPSSTTSLTKTTPLVVDISSEDDCLVVRNNLQRKKFVETSNKRGLATPAILLPATLSDQAVSKLAEEDERFLHHQNPADMIRCRHHRRRGAHRPRVAERK
jgi:hypothetical protein